MAQLPNPTPLLFSVILLLSASASLALSDSNSTVFELLPKYGLPSGLLPSSVADYTLSDDGRFVVALTKPCYIQFDYLIYYEAKITGKLSYGAIIDLKGIQVKRFSLFWFDVDEIRVDLPPSDSIYFTVGIINKKLDVDQFQTVRSCRDDASCFGSIKRVVQLPSPLEEEIKMLLTE